MFGYLGVICSSILLLALKSLGAPTNAGGSESECKLARIDTHLSIASQLIEDARRKLPEDLKDLCEKATSNVTPLDCSECGRCPAVAEPTNCSENENSFTSSKPTNCSENENSFTSSKPTDCSDIYQNGNDEDGIYEIWPERMVSKEALSVYCDMTTDGGGWTVIQRRGDFKNSYDFFDQDWDAYKAGFGDVLEDFWIGNRNIFDLTNQRSYELRIDLTDWEENFKYATYSQFWIDHEFHNYVLHIGRYNGTAGDSLQLHNGKYFTAKDKDNDEQSEFNCATLWKGAWWYKKCYSVNLNGLYRNGTHAPRAGGVHWYGFKGFEYSLKDTVMMIRPTDFKERLSLNGTNV